MRIEADKIEAMIYKVRGVRVMLDSDLALLYGVETKRLNEQVRRNIERFPIDFMFQITAEEFEFLKSQIATSKRGSGGKQKLPLVFTENGVAMLSSVLRSQQAINVNIAIMRTFTRLRSFLAMDSSLKEEVGKLRTGTNKLFKIVFERLDNLENQIEPKIEHNKKKIGIRPN